MPRPIASLAMAALVNLICLLGCDPTSSRSLREVDGSFEINPRIYCSGDSLTFKWSLVNVSRVRVVSETGRVIVEGGREAELTGTIEASDGLLDVLVVWDGDGKEYSARAKVPDVAAPALHLVSKDHDAWTELTGKTYNEVEETQGGWTAVGDGASRCCPPQSCVAGGGAFTWDDQTLTVRGSDCKAPYGTLGRDCRMRDSRREELVTSMRVTSTEFTIDRTSPRVKILGLRNNVGAPYAGASLSAPAMGVVDLASGAEALFTPTTLSRAVLRVQTPSPLALEHTQWRDAFFVAADPLSEECPAVLKGSDPNCKRDPELCPRSWDVSGAVGLLRCQE